MTQFVANVSSNGRVTIPAGLREFLGVTAGDKIRFVVDYDGLVRIEKVKYPTIAPLRGAAGSLAESKSWKEIEESVRDERAERFRDKYLHGDDRFPE